MVETPKTPREMIREMSRPMVIFGSCTPVTPTVFPNFFKDQSSTPGIAIRPTDGYESDDYSWDFKCKGDDEAEDDLADTFDVLCDLNRNVHEHALPDILSPSDNGSHLAKVLEEVESNLISRYAEDGMHIFDEGRPTFSIAMPILCLGDNSASTEPPRRPLSIVYSNISAPPIPEQSHARPTVRSHIRSTSLSNRENAPGPRASGQSTYPARSMTRGHRIRSSRVYGKKRIGELEGLQ